jgi:hypothetical protein
MNIKRKFKNIFKIFLDKNKSNQLLDLLQSLYDDKILTKELILNLIKGMVIIFYIDNFYYELYFEILNYFYNNLCKDKQKIIVSSITKIDLRLQFELTEYYIDKVIIYTNNLLSLVVKYDIELILDIWIYIINQINKFKFSKEIKIILYSQLIKDIILTTSKDFDLNKIKNQINISVHLIKKI